MEMNWADKLSWVLIIVGGLNWGLVGFLDYNLVDSLLGAGSTVSRVVYAVVGVAAVYSLVRMVTMMSSMSKTAK